MTILTYRYDLNAQPPIFMRFRDEIPKAIIANDINALYADEGDNLWIGVKLHGIFVLNKNRDYFTHYTHEITIMLVFPVIASRDLCRHRIGIYG